MRTLTCIIELYIKKERAIIEVQSIFPFKEPLNINLQVKFLRFLPNLN